MKSNENPLINTQIDIVKVLLDGKTKSQRQIADEIGKEESTVSKALDYLEGVVIKEEKEILSGGRRNKGIYKNKLCHLTYQVENGKHVLQFFRKVAKIENLKNKKDFFDFLQKNDQILSLLVKEHFWLIDYESVEAWLDEPNMTKKLFGYKSVEAWLDERDRKKEMCERFLDERDSNKEMCDACLKQPETSPPLCDDRCHVCLKQPENNPPLCDDGIRSVCFEFQKNPELNRCDVCLKQPETIPPLCGDGIRSRCLKLREYQESGRCDTCLKQLETSPPLCGDHDRSVCLEYQKGSVFWDKMAIDADAELKRQKDKTQKNLIILLGKRLRTSPYFFEVCLTSTDEELKQRFGRVYNLSLEAHLKTNFMERGYKWDVPEAIIRTHFDKIFEISVYYDMFKGNELEAAVKEILEMNMVKADVSENAEYFDLSAYVAFPKFLQSRFEESNKRYRERLIEGFVLNGTKVREKLIDILTKK